MTLYGSMLFVHVVAAIALVGGSAGAHLALVLARRADTVDGTRSLVTWASTFVRASGPLAAVVGLAGLYLTFDGQWWGRGWPVVSLVLFAVAGAAAAGVVDPRLARVRDRLAELAPEPATAQTRTALADRTLAMTVWVMTGIDLAIVALMTNKPGWTGAVVVALVGLALGALVGVRETRHTPVEVAPAAG